MSTVIACIVPLCAGSFSYHGLLAAAEPLEMLAAAKIPRANVAQTAPIVENFDKPQQFYYVRDKSQILYYTKAQLNQIVRRVKSGNRNLCFWRGEVIRDEGEADSWHCKCPNWCGNYTGVACEYCGSQNDPSLTDSERDTMLWAEVPQPAPSDSENALIDAVLKPDKKSIEYFSEDKVQEAVTKVKESCDAKFCFYGGTIIRPLARLEDSSIPCFCTCPSWCWFKIMYVGHACEYCRAWANPELPESAKIELVNKGLITTTTTLVPTTTLAPQVITTPLDPHRARYDVLPMLTRDNKSFIMYSKDIVMRCVQAVKYQCADFCLFGGQIVNIISLPLIFVRVAKCGCRCPLWCRQRVKWTGYGCEFCSIFDDPNVTPAEKKLLNVEGILGGRFNKLITDY